MLIWSRESCVYLCQSVAVLLAERDKIQKEIQNLEDVLGPHSPVCVSGNSPSYPSVSMEM